MNRRTLVERSAAVIAALAAPHTSATADLHVPRTDETQLGATSAATNKALMQRIFADLAVGETRLFVDCLADDVVMRVTGQYSWSRTFHGKAVLMKELYGHLRSVVTEAGRTIPLRFIADEDHVAVEARGDMVTRTGVKYDNEYCLVFRLRDSKIVEMREYCDSVLTEKVLGIFPSG
jgi:uncharacterized protein